MTDINPVWHPHGRTMFDVGRVSQLDAQTINDRLALFMGTLLQAAAGTCTRALCQACALLLPIHLAQTLQHVHLLYPAARQGGLLGLHRVPQHT